jgi:hypothetical protein
MIGLKRYRFNPALLLSVALLLRAVIPAGYMPSSSGGLLFEFCPDGIPMEFMQLLSGDSGHSHNHGAHEDSGQAAHQCPIGHMLSSAAAFDDHWQAEALLAPPAPIDRSIYEFAARFRPPYLSRGPPA